MSGIDPTPYVYQYGVGGLVFALGMAAGYLKGCWSFRKGERADALAVFAIFVGYALLQGFFQFVAPRL